MIKKLELSKQVRIKKFLSYIDDISKKKSVSYKKIIENNLKCFNFNLKSGPNLMHPLHFAV
jgi:CRISPR/Cas system CMR subunit Cmr6 (Cas7 group RAMP superfamily)